MMAAMALPAIFKALMTTFQKRAEGAELIPEGQTAQSRQK